MSSFTDELIKDLDQNEKDAKRAKISRLAVLRETIGDSEGHLMFFISVMAPVLALFFVFTTCSFIVTYNRLPQIEEGIFQFFEVREISVEVLDKDSPILSEVLESAEVSFVELGEMAQQGGVVYYSRKPSAQFFIVDEYWSVAYYYVNERLRLACGVLEANSLFSPATGIGLLVMAICMYKPYKIKYKEMAGL